MKLLAKTMLLLGISAGAWGAATPAEAQWCGGYGLGYGGFGPYSVYSLDTIPYFAMYPPVYYSHIVPRPYGFSPFAYPPGVRTPQRIRLEPAMIVNPHVKIETKVESVDQRTVSSGPLTIANPYYTRDGQPAREPVQQARGPQTVYPLATAKN